MSCTRRGSGLWGGLLGLPLALCALNAGAAAAQTCGGGGDDDDGGMICMGGDDGGEPVAEPGGDSDSGMSMAPAGSGGRGGNGASGFGGFGGSSATGMDGGLRGDHDQCSCTATIDDEKQGRIHVCTEGQTHAACNDFSCARGRVAPNMACVHTNVRLCCVMKRRGLVSVLYDDCTQANCEPGFSEQCADFDGELHRGDCQSFDERNDNSDGGGGGCTITGNSGRAAGDQAGLAFGVLGLLLARFSCRRPAARRRFAAAPQSGPPAAR